MTSEALGLWNLGDDSFHRRIDSITAKRIIKVSYKSGIRTFDSAYSYTDADTILCSALKEIKAERNEWRIIEKIMPTPTLSRKAEAIMRRLNTTFLDILLIHWPAEEGVLYSALKTLESLKEKGVAKEIGVSNFPLPLLEKTAADFPISYHERPLSLIWNRDWEEEKKTGIKTLSYAPLGLGALTGEKKEKLESLFFYSSPKFNALNAELKNIAHKYNTTVQVIALSWVYEKGPYMIIRGASSLMQLDNSPIALDSDDITALDNLSDEITSLCLKDNIFSHNWKGGAYEKT